MANKILFSEGNVDDILGRLRSLQSEISSVHTTLAGVDTSASAGGDIYGGSGVSLSGLAGSRISGGTVRECVQGYRRATSSYSAYFGDLSRALRQVKDLFESTERDQVAQAHGNDSGSGGKSGAGRKRRPSIIAPIGPWPIIDWGSILGPLFPKVIPRFRWPRTNYPPMPILIPPGMVSDFMWKLLTGQYDTKGALVSNGLTFNTPVGKFGVNGSFLGYEVKTKDFASWGFEEGKDGYTFGFFHENKVEGYLAQLKSTYESPNGIISASQAWTVGGGSLAGGIGATLFKEGVFQPYAGLSAKGEAYVLGVKNETKIGTDDINYKNTTEAKVLGADFDAKAGIGYDAETGEIGGSAKFEAEAYVAKAEGSHTFEIFGVKIGAKGEVMYGVNATAGGEVNTGGASGELGLGPLKVKLSVDWSGLRDKVVSWFS